MILIHIFRVFGSCIVIIELLFVHLARRDCLVIFLLLRARSNLIKVSLREEVNQRESVSKIFNSFDFALRYFFCIFNYLKITLRIKVSSLRQNKGYH